MTPEQKNQLEEFILQQGKLLQPVLDYNAKFNAKYNVGFDFWKSVYENFNKNLKNYRNGKQ